MSLFQAVRQAEASANKLLAANLVPIGILREGVGESVIDPLTLEVLSTSGTECFPTQGITAMYSSQELSSGLLSNKIEIGTGSKKVLVKNLVFVPVVGEFLLLWGNSDVAYQGFTVEVLDGSVHSPALPKTLTRVAWIVTKSGTVGGLPVLVGDMLYSPTGSLGGLWEDVQTEWVKESYKRKADIVMVVHQEYIGIGLQLLHVKF
jgi:hypothetical protein